jgi:hypothetical protein
MTLQEMLSDLRDSVVCDWDADSGVYIARAKSDNRVIGVVIPDSNKPTDRELAKFIPLDRGHT